MIRSNIMNLGKEHNYIIYLNVDETQKKMRTVLNDQFVKLRNHFSWRLDNIKKNL